VNTLNKENITRLREFLEMVGWNRARVAKCGPRYFTGLQNHLELALRNRPQDLQILPFAEEALTSVNDQKSLDAFKLRADRMWSEIERLSNKTLVILDWTEKFEMTKQGIALLHRRSAATGRGHFNAAPAIMAKHWQYARISRVLAARSDIHIFPGADWTREAHEQVKTAPKTGELSGIDHGLVRVRSLTLFIQALERATECGSRTVAMVQEPELWNSLEHLAAQTGIPFLREPEPFEFHQIDMA